MQITIDQHLIDDAVVVAVAGEIDVYTAPQLREHFVGVVGAGHKRVVVDLDEVQFMDSTGLGVLVGIMKRLRTVDGGSLNLVCSYDRLRKIFEITGLDKVLPLHDTRADALAAGTPTTGTHPR